MNLLTDKDLSEIFKVKVSTIRTWVNRGIIPDELIFKLPNYPKGTRRFIESRVMEWIETNGCIQTQTN